jgi:anthranilate/para-aminobenzoate synthase component II
VGLQFHPEAVLTEHGYDLLRNFLGDAGSSRSAAE